MNGIIDVNTAIGHWPFRPLPGSVETLSQQMQLSGIKKALSQILTPFFIKILWMATRSYLSG